MADDPRAAARALLPGWQERLRLRDWDIRISELEPGTDRKSGVEIDAVTRIAVITLRADTPRMVVSRQLVHELLHVRLAELEDVTNQAIAQGGPAFQELADRWRHRATESSIEALTDALTESTRAEWCTGAVWDEAFAPAPDAVTEILNGRTPL